VAGLLVIGLEYVIPRMKWSVPSIDAWVEGT
jgi:hypothetical protein